MACSLAVVAGEAFELEHSERFRATQVGQRGCGLDRQAQLAFDRPFAQGPVEYRLLQRGGTLLEEALQGLDGRALISLQTQSGANQAGDIEDRAAGDDDRAPDRGDGSSALP